MNELLHATDLGDAEWAILAPLLASPTRRGRPRLHDRRLVLDAIAVRAARRSRLAPAARAVPALVVRMISPGGGYGSAAGGRSTTPGASGRASGLGRSR